MEQGAVNLAGPVKVLSLGGFPEKYGALFKTPAETRALFASLGAEPARTWSVGDNLEWDVGAPQSFGAYGIWVDVRRGGLPEGAPVRPDRVIQSVRELIDAH